MATLTEYTTGYTDRAAGQKEQLSDLITALNPSSLHLWNRLSHKSVEGIYPIWQTYDLASAAQNSALEGGDFAEDTFTPPTQTGNYTQINKKQVKVSRTLDKLAKAGRASEYQFIKGLKTKEMMRDIEYSLMQGTVSAGASNGGRGVKGVISWITTNTSSGTAAGTAGNRPLTLALIDAQLQAAYDQGGEPNVVYVSSGLAATFAGLATAATDRRRVSNDSERLTNRTRFYDNPQGLDVQILIHRHMPSTTLVALDEQHWQVGVFDAPFHEMLAKAGDNVRGQVIAEYTLISAQQKASAKLEQVV